jgi:hypothetical protein
MRTLDQLKSFDICTALHSDARDVMDFGSLAVMFLCTSML